MPNPDKPTIVELAYRYLARDWGLLDDQLTIKKCQILRRSISPLRKSYQNERRIRYDKVSVRRAYVASYAPRYARLLSAALQRVESHALEIANDWHRKELVVAMFGGGPAFEIFGLINWLYRHDIQPRYVHVVMIDQERYWRSFHSYWFADAINARFRKTMVIPSYELIRFPATSAERDGFEHSGFPYTQAGLLTRTQLITMTNFLSEFAEPSLLEQSLRYLCRLPNNECLFLSVDSAARKRRPRMTWLTEFFDSEPIKSQRLFEGLVKVKARNKGRDETSQKIFAAGGPSWMLECNRWVHARILGR